MSTPFCWYCISQLSSVSTCDIFTVSALLLWLIYLQLNQQFVFLALLPDFFLILCKCVCVCFHKCDPHPRGLSEMPVTSYDSVWGHSLWVWLVCLESKKELFRSAECSFCPCVNALCRPRVCVHNYTCHHVVLWDKDDVLPHAARAKATVRHSERLVSCGPLCACVRDLVESLSRWLFSAALRGMHCTCFSMKL